jgi:hypothetical protein
MTTPTRRTQILKSTTHTRREPPPPDLRTPPSRLLPF